MGYEGSMSGVPADDGELIVFNKNISGSCLFQLGKQAIEFFRAGHKVRK